MKVDCKVEYWRRYDYPPFCIAFSMFSSFVFERGSQCLKITQKVLFYKIPIRCLLPLAVPCFF